MIRQISQVVKAQRAPDGTPQCAGQCVCTCGAIYPRPFKSFKFTIGVFCKHKMRLRMLAITTHCASHQNYRLTL